MFICYKCYILCNITSIGAPDGIENAIHIAPLSVVKISMGILFIWKYNHCGDGNIPAAAWYEQMNLDTLEQLILLMPFEV